MFSQNELEKYQQLKAPDDLKNQVIKNVDATHKRNRKIAVRFAAATACLLFAVLGIKMYMSRNPLVSIDGVPVSYNARTIDNTTPYEVANNTNEQHLQICIPLEVKVYDETIITVSEGILTTDEIISPASTICINEPKDIMWYISKDDVTCAKCTISTGNRKYIYEVVFNKKTNNYNIRQLENE